MAFSAIVYSFIHQIQLHVDCITVIQLDQVCQTGGPTAEIRPTETIPTPTPQRQKNIMIYHDTAGDVSGFDTPELDDDQVV